MVIRNPRLAGFLGIFFGIMMAILMFPMSTFVFTLDRPFIELVAAFLFFIGFPILFIVGGIYSFRLADKIEGTERGKKVKKGELEQIVSEFIKIDNKEAFLRNECYYDWPRLKPSYEMYELGEIDAHEFVEFALKTLGKRFSKLFYA